MRPVTRYARNGDVSLAYQVIGEGERDLVFTTGWWLAFESLWEDPACARALESMASFARVILWDKRGTGMSDRVELPTLEERMEDLGAVMDAAGSDSATLFGFSEGGCMGALFAASYPERCDALVLCGSFARPVRDGDEQSWMPSREVAESFFSKEMEREWGAETRLLRLWAPSRASDPRLQEWWMRAGRLGASPAAGVAWMRRMLDIDIRHVLPAVRVPTLVIHAVDDRICPVEASRYIAASIPGARLLELPGDDHLWWLGHPDRILDEVESLVTGAPARREATRVLATVLFTDIVGSTRRAADLGDSGWRDLVESHDAAMRGQLQRHGGREVKTMGDGFLATFDGPARAIRCATSMRDSARDLGVEIRAGLHTGECEVQNGDLAGIAVNIGARVGALASPGEVLVSSTVKDLVAGSRIEFDDRGSHELKGVPGEWRLFSVGEGA